MVALEVSCCAIKYVVNHSILNEFIIWCGLFNEGSLLTYSEEDVVWSICTWESYHVRLICFSCSVELLELSSSLIVCSLILRSAGIGQTILLHLTNCKLKEATIIILVVTISVNSELEWKYDRSISICTITIVSHLTLVGSKLVVSQLDIVWCKEWILINELELYWWCKVWCTSFLCNSNVVSCSLRSRTIREVNDSILCQCITECIHAHDTCWSIVCTTNNAKQLRVVYVENLVKWCRCISSTKCCSHCIFNLAQC